MRRSPDAKAVRRSLLQGNYSLKLLESEEKEIAALSAGSIATLKASGASLAAEKFEHIAETLQREAELVGLPRILPGLLAGLPGGGRQGAHRAPRT